MTERRRPRRGSLERPLSTRLYRAAWFGVAVPLLVMAFTVGRPEPLPPPPLPPTFDTATALQFASELARRFPDRRPGSPGAFASATWVAARLADYRIESRRDEFSAELPGLGRRTLVNLMAIIPGRSPEAIVVIAHRDNIPLSPGANDNASGTAALLELARDASTAAIGGTSRAALAHTLVFVSTDAGDYGGVGAAKFAADPAFARRTEAVVNLDALAAPQPPRVQFAGDTAVSPPATLLATVDASLRAQAGVGPARPSAFAQIVDLAFPFSLYEQAPFVARGTPAVTLTTSGDRPAAPAGDTVEALDGKRLGALGRSAQALVGSLDAGADVARGTGSYVYLGARLLRGWTIEFVLLAALVPFLAVTVDLFARCRRRGIRLAPALRSYRSRLGVWLWIGAVFAFLTFVGLLPDGAPRPLDPNTELAGDWPIAALLALLGLSAVGWLVARPRLRPVEPVARAEELGGHLAAMVALGLVALVVAAVNPYALLFLLPSLHAWLWLTHASSRHARLALYALGFAGPFIVFASFAFRFGLGLDAPWYVMTLVSVGYVRLPLILSFVAWAAAAEQVGALALGRYAPYPDKLARPARGPIRETIRHLVLLSRRRRRAARQVAADGEAEALEER
jgi:hypothetical protein